VKFSINGEKPTYSRPSRFVDKRLSAPDLSVTGGCSLNANGWPVGAGKASTVYYLDPNPTDLMVIVTKGAASQVTITQPTGAIGGPKNITSKFDASGVARINAAGLDGHGISMAVYVTDPGETRWALIEAADYDRWKADPLAFAPWWIAKLNGFSSFRAMDWMKTNDDRTPDYPEGDPVNRFSAFSTGMPISLIVKLAKEQGLAPWIEIGAYDNDDTVRSIFTRLEALRAAHIRVSVDYSNEVWNTGFAACTYAKAQEAALFPTEDPKTMTGQRWYGYRSTQISRVIQAMGWRPGVDFAMGDAVPRAAGVGRCRQGGWQGCGLLALDRDSLCEWHAHWRL
jgi:hypothetical protein